jgi:hypothetical protein
MTAGDEGEHDWPWSDPGDGLSRTLVGAGDAAWVRLAAPGLGPGGARDRLLVKLARLQGQALAGILPSRVLPGAAADPGLALVEVGWGARVPLGDAVNAAEEHGVSPDLIAHGIVAVCAGAGRALTALAGAGLSAGGLSPHQLGIGRDGSVALEVASGWLASARREALKLSAERLFTVCDDGVLLLELAVSLMSGGAPWAELVAHVLDRGRLLEPEARLGGPRVIARALDELCGCDDVADQAVHVIAAFARPAAP